MPFKSEKQRRWMYANKPEMAKRWQKKHDKKTKESSLKVGNETIQTLIEALGERAAMPQGEMMPSPSMPTRSPYGKAMEALSGAGESIFGRPNIPDQIELASTRASLPETFYQTPEMQQFLESANMTPEMFEEQFMPGARTTMPGEPVREAISAGQVAAPAAAAGIGAGALTKGMVKARRHAELMQALKGMLGTKKTGAAKLTSSLETLLVKQGKKKHDMPSFTRQDRPKKVKEIYRALKRDHPDMPAEMKARIAARQGKPGKQKQGPPYKGPIKNDYSEKNSAVAKLAIGLMAKDAGIRDLLNRVTGGMGPSMPIAESGYRRQSAGLNPETTGTPAAAQKSIPLPAKPAQQPAQRPAPAQAAASQPYSVPNAPFSQFLAELTQKKKPLW